MTVTLGPPASCAKVAESVVTPPAAVADWTLVASRAAWVAVAVVFALLA